MIRVELGTAVLTPNNTRFHWTVGKSAWHGELRGLSHQPLLDACRAIKRAGGPPASAVALFREGRDEPDLICRSVEEGAGLTVIERDKGSITFGPYRDPSTWGE